MKELIQALINQGIITANDIQRMTTLELLLSIVKRVNELHGLTKEGLEAVQRLLDEGVREEVVAQLDKWVQDGTFDTLINQSALKKVNERIDETNAQLSRKVDIFKIDTNFSNQDIQNILDLADSTNQLNVIFLDGVYELGELRIKKNTNIILSSGAVINVKDKHLFYNFETTDVFKNYKGNGNIKISGGTINGHCMSMIHAHNVEIEGVTFQNSINDHYFEICASKNVKIRNCSFYGVTMQTEDRNYVEMIQLDTCSWESFPWLPNSSLMFDGTPNENILIENCNFNLGTMEGYRNIYAAIGSHVVDFTKVQKNITIKNCEFNDCYYAGIRIVGWKNVCVEGCRFNNCERGIYMTEYAKIITIRKNTFSSCQTTIDTAGGGIYDLAINNNVFEFTRSMIMNLSDVKVSNINNNYFEQNKGIIYFKNSNHVMFNENDFNHPIFTDKNYIICIDGEPEYVFPFILSNNCFGDKANTSNLFELYFPININSNYSFEVVQKDNFLSGTYNYAICYNNKSVVNYPANKLKQIEFTTEHDIQNSDCVITSDRQVTINMKIVANSDIPHSQWTTIATSTDVQLNGERVVLVSSTNNVYVVGLINSSGINIKPSATINTGDELRVFSQFSY